MLLAGVLLLINSSCAKVIPIPETDYRKTDPSKDKTYRLTTKEDRVYDFNRFMVTDSTLIILEVKTYDRPSFLVGPSGQEPIVVPWGSVKSLERYSYNNKLTKIMIVAGAAAGLYAIYWIVGAIAISQMNWGD